MEEDSEQVDAAVGFESPGAAKAVEGRAIGGVREVN